MENNYNRISQFVNVWSCVQEENGNQLMKTTTNYVWVGIKIIVLLNPWISYKGGEDMGQNTKE